MKEKKGSKEGRNEILKRKEKKSKVVKKGLGV